MGQQSVRRSDIVGVLGEKHRPRKSEAVHVSLPGASRESDSYRTWFLSAPSITVRGVRIVEVTDEHNEHCAVSSGGSE